MKADIKAQWVKDLRSGEFEQGIAYLDQIEDGKRKFCCLGVLCQQAVKAGVIPEPELHAGRYSYLDDQFNGDGQPAGESFNQWASLPRKVAEWAGVGTDSDIAIDSDMDGPLYAAEANDTAGLTFAEIADLVEQNVPVTE